MVRLDFYLLRTASLFDIKYNSNFKLKVREWRYYLVTIGEQMRMNRCLKILHLHLHLPPAPT